MKPELFAVDDQLIGNQSTLDKMNLLYRHAVDDLVEEGS